MRRYFAENDFRFIVEIQGVGRISCEEATGLDSGSDMVEYRSGGMPGPSMTPSLMKTEEVTLRQVRFKEDKAVMDWFMQPETGGSQPRDMTVSLLDGDGTAMHVWRLAGARLKKFMLEPADGSEDISMETVTISHSGIMTA